MVFKIWRRAFFWTYRELHLPFHTVRQPWGQVRCWCIMSSNSIQKTIPGGNSNTASSFRHLGTGGPFIGVGVKTFYRLKARTSIPTSNSIQPKNRNVTFQGVKSKTWFYLLTGVGIFARSHFAYGIFPILYTWKKWSKCSEIIDSTTVSIHIRQHFQQVIILLLLNVTTSVTICLQP